MISCFSWRRVRARIWVKAEELYMQDQVCSWGCSAAPERCEIREGGYFDQAKLLVLREVQVSGVC